MTIGAVSTVMAADYPVIASWKEVKEDVWEAYDAEGNKIQRGWAVSESGIYYYFKNSVMATSTFVKTGNKTYYVNAEGAMHTGWIEFNKDSKVSYNYSENVTVDVAFSGYSTIGSENIAAFTDKTQYKTVWMYFKADGTLAINEWEEVDGIWYFLDGPFCVMNDWNFVITVDENGKAMSAPATYGFDASGAMMAGWANYYKATDTTTNKDTPYTGTDTAKDSRWVYYAPNGKKATAGWLKDAAGEWYFMLNDDKVGVKAVQNAFVEIATTNKKGEPITLTFFFDESGRKVDGYYTFAASSSKDLTTKKYLVTMTAANTISENGTVDVVTVKKDKDIYFFDSANGMVYTTEPNKKAEYLQVVGENKMYKINVVKNASGTAIEVTTEAIAEKKAGELWTETFLFVDDSGVYYYDNGYKMTNFVLAVGDKFLAFGSDGKLITKTAEKDALTIDGVKYVMGTETFIDGVTYSVVFKK